MGSQQIDIRATSSARPGALWRLLADSSTWPSWTPIDSYEGVRPARPDGTGEVRVFRTGRHTVREEIVHFTPERRLSYTLLAGLALRGYRADIDVTGTGDGGTALRWHTSFQPKVPGTGWVYRRALHKATQRFVEGLVRAAEQAGAASQAG